VLRTSRPVGCWGGRLPTASRRRGRGPCYGRGVSLKRYPLLTWTIGRRRNSHLGGGRRLTGGHGPTGKPPFRGRRWPPQMGAGLLRWAWARTGGRLGRRPPRWGVCCPTLAVQRPLGPPRAARKRRSPVSVRWAAAQARGSSEGRCSMVLLAGATGRRGPQGTAANPARDTQSNPACGGGCRRGRRSRPWSSPPCCPAPLCSAAGRVLPSRRRCSGDRGMTGGDDVGRCSGCRPGTRGCAGGPALAGMARTAPIQPPVGRTRVPE